MPGAPGGAMTDAPGGRGREGCRSLSTRRVGHGAGRFHTHPRFPLAWTLGTEAVTIRPGQM